MPFPFNIWPWNRDSDLNVAYWTKQLAEISRRAIEDLTTLEEWKTDLEQGLETWKSGVLSSITQWETAFTQAIDLWKSETEGDLVDWKSATLNDLEAWKAAFFAEYESLEQRVEAIVSSTEDMIENLAPPFLANTAYSAGEYVIQNGLLYKFMVDHAAGAWIGTDAVHTTAMAAIKRIDDTLEDAHFTSWALREKTAVTYGSYRFASGFYLEEQDKNGGNLYFKILRASIQLFNDGAYITPASNTVILNSLGVTAVTSPNGIPDCIQIPNNTALAFDLADRTWKFTLRNELTESMIVLFINAWGRADNLHPLLMEEKIWQDKYFVNVLAFGADNSGGTDSTQAFQSALNAVRNTGGTVWVPSGTYLIGTSLWDAGSSTVAAALHIFNNTHLMMDKNALIRTNANVNHLLFTHNEESATAYTGARNIEISGGIIDDNSALSRSSTPINISHANNIYIHDIHFQNGHASNSWHFIEVNSSKNVKIERCNFIAGAGKTEDIQIDAANGAGNLGSADDTVCYDIYVTGCHFESGAHPAVGNHTDAAHHNIRISSCDVRGNNTRGAFAFTASVDRVDVSDCTIYQNSAALTIGQNQPSCVVRDCRLENVTQAGVNCTAHNNMINGVWAA